MSSLDARARLAARQAELVRALVGGGEVPADFDADRIRLAARSLISKRVREVARAWPALGTSFTERFRAYAQATPPPGEGGPLADGRAFLGTLAAGETGDEVRRAVLWVDLLYCATRAGLRPRRGPALRWTWLAEAGRLLVGIRLPWLGVRVVSLPWRRTAGPEKAR